MPKAVMSSIGPDKPGIVAAITRILNQYGCNIEDSTMTRLRDEFATILLLEIPESVNLDTLRQEFSRLLEAEMGMIVTLKPVEERIHADTKANSEPYMISVAGEDRTGITYHVTQVLADSQVNITDLNAQVIEGENGPVYIMMLEVDIPSDAAATQVTKALKALESQLEVEIQVRPLEGVAL